MSKYGGKALTGRNPLAYMGVEAGTPAQFVNMSRVPTVNDYKNYNVGTVWFCSDPTTKIATSIWMLAGLTPLSVATWVQLWPASNGEIMFVTDANSPSISAGHTLVLEGDVGLAPAGILQTTGTNGLGNTVNIAFVGGNDGQIPISSSLGGGTIWANITPGNGIGITNGANSISVATNINYGDSVGGFAHVVGNALNFLGVGGTTIAAAGNTITIGGGGGGVMNLVNGFNINIDSTAPASPIVNLNRSIIQPVTNSTATEGMYSLGASYFMHGYGTHNTFLGQAAGNLGLTVLSASENTGVGFSVLSALTTGQWNTGLGDVSLSSLNSGASNTAAGSSSQQSLTSGSRNSTLGVSSLQQLLTGNDNVMLGAFAGYNYVGAESNNIIIGSDFGTAGESNKIRIGEQGSHDKTFVAGIYGITPDVATQNVVFADTNGQLGTGVNPANGEILIGGTGGPQWKLLKGSAGIGIAVGDHSITITSGGGGAGGLITMHTDVGDATIDAFNAMTVMGLGPVITGGALNTFTVGLTAAADGYLLMGRTANTAVWNTLVSGDASINIIRGPGTIDIRAIGGGGGGAAQFTTDSGTANALGVVLQVKGADNINTSGATNIVTVHLNKSISQPDTNASATEGMYSLGSHYFLHNFGTANTFLGEDSGNLLLTGTDNTCAGIAVGQAITSASSNSLYGSNCGTSITSGNNNCGFGSDSLQHVTSGGGNVSLGFQNLNGITTGQNNISIGNASGSLHITGDSSNIDIGHVGVAGQSGITRIGTNATHTKAFVAGIYQTAGYAGTKEIALINNSDQLGSVSVLPIALGGTNATSMTTSQAPLYFDGASVATLPYAAGTSGLFLRSNSPLAPTWVAVGGGTGTVTAVSATAPLFASMATPTPNLSFHAATNGMVLIANNTTSPVWASIGAGSGITITSGAGTLSIAASGIVATTYAADTGTAQPAANTINIVGGAAIKTKASGSTITINDTLTMNNQTANYVLALTDAGKYITMNVVTGNTVTIPLAPGVPWDIGTQIVIQQLGAGQTSIVAAGGVTIRSAGGRLKLTEQYSMAALVYIALNTWAVGGDTTL